MRRYLDILREASVPSQMIGEEFTGGFEGRNGHVEVFKNPSRNELQKLVEHDSIRMFLTKTDALAWKPYRALHREVVFAIGEEINLGRDAIPIVLYPDFVGRHALCDVTDATRGTKWFHNPETAAMITQHPYLRRLFAKKIEVSYYDEDIVGDWAKLDHQPVGSPHSA